jgi:hypothetical protein
MTCVNTGHVKLHLKPELAITIIIYATFACAGAQHQSHVINHPTLATISMLCGMSLNQLSFVTFIHVLC